MQPNISLSYSSDGASSTVGQGWNLASGFSAILRVGKDWRHDGDVSPVKNDQTDLFVLDGSRLILTSGIYGQSGSEYATENENFSKIILHDYNEVDGIVVFKVITKSGTTMLYEGSLYISIFVVS